MQPMRNASENGQVSSSTLLDEIIKEHDEILKREKIGHEEKFEYESDGNSMNFITQIKEIKDLIKRYLKDANHGDVTETYQKKNMINCTFKEYFCNPSADDLLYKVDDTITTPNECMDACKKVKICNIFTFFNFRRSPACYLLKSCQEKKPLCTEPSNCMSGDYRNCQDNKVCPKLKFTKGENARWRCKGVNPYVEDIPEGTHCFAT